MTHAAKLRAHMHHRKTNMLLMVIQEVQGPGHDGTARSKVSDQILNRD